MYPSSEIIKPEPIAAESSLYTEIDTTDGRHLSYISCVVRTPLSLSYSLTYTTLSELTEGEERSGVSGAIGPAKTNLFNIRSTTRAVNATIKIPVITDT